ncbi:hypothetical protein ACO0RG_004660 [Hanseniaspora osmophila]
MTVRMQERQLSPANQECKRAKTIPSFRINTYTFAGHHPTGIKPSGNYFLEVQDEQQFKENRARLLGKLSIFPEEFLTHFIHNYIDDPTTLKNLGQASRLFYSYTFDEELWRKMYIDEYLKLEKNNLAHFSATGKNDKTDTTDFYTKIQPFGIKKWLGSWRKTILGISRGEDEALISCNNLIYSDMLFRPFQCTQVDYEHLFQKIIAFEKKSSQDICNYNKDFGIDRFDEDDFTMEMFESKYIDKPFILKSKNNKRWPTWTINDLLKQFPTARFRQETVNWDLQFYVDYFVSNKDESPLYLFDCNSDAMKQIRSKDNYEVPFFSQADFFKIFNDQKHNCRPDHSWLITGPKRTGSTFHKDPNHTSAWNAGLSGIKLWVMLPSHIVPPGVTTDAEENEVTSPIGTAEWILSGYYNDSVKLALNNANNFDGVNCLIGMTFPGECIHVPAGWWHTVINITDSVAITENFVPRLGLPKVLNFLKNKRNQISGFHLKDFLESVKIFLQQHNESGNPANENITILQKFVVKYSDKIVTNEDCGVLEELGDFSLPLYELFTELLKRDSSLNPDEFAILMNNVSNIEAADVAKSGKGHLSALKESEMWTNLINKDLESENSGGFSFGFLESDDDEDTAMIN